MIGTALNHYRIIKALGSGGMGEVYEAEDTKLRRSVAVNVLPEAVAADPERRQRFEREARAIAALNHANIVTVYSIEQAADRLFLTMELVRGRTLAAVITRRGMEVAPFLQFALPIAEALSAAHRQGIIHRDLKPDNIMVGDDGRGATDVFSVLPPERTPLTEGEAPQVSPDGRTIAFVATEHSGRTLLYVRDRGALAARALPESDDATLPFWSPDSRSIGFFAGGKLKRVDLLVHLGAERCGSLHGSINPAAA